MSDHPPAQPPGDTPDADPFETMATDQARAYNQGLTPLHPPHKSLLRLKTTVIALIVSVAAAIVESILRFQAELPISAGAIILPVAAAMLFLITQLPNRIYRRWGYDMGTLGEPDELRILQGFLWRTDTIVPLNRIQHIDVFQGPLQRLFGLSTLDVHTAGTHNSIVSLPGLATAQAEAMRDTIKGHIRQELT